MSSTPPDLTLDALRGNLPRGRANARSIAALTDNPACARRRVLDAAAIRVHEVATAAGPEFDPKRGQSPFAITSGITFERMLKAGSNYARLVEALAPLLALPENLADLRVIDLGHEKGARNNQWLRRRVARTDIELTKIAQNTPDAPHVVDHPVLEFSVAGAPVFLEPDALAFRDGNRLELVEIKSYAIIDEQADPSKLASTSGQAAVYLIALRATLTRLGFDPDLLRPSVILVAPKNFARFPTAHRIPLVKKVAALQRALAHAPRIDDVLHHLPGSLTFDVDPNLELPPEQRRRRLRDALESVPHVFVPECLGACDLARFCRDEALRRDDPARLGRAVRDTLAGVPTLASALALARGTEAPRDDQEDVAAALTAAWGALQRARRAAGLGSTP
jgi:hypothetical protein